MLGHIRKFLPFAVIAMLFMAAEVLADLLLPDVMSRLIDEGIMGKGNGGVSSLPLVLKLGLEMAGIAVVGGLCGSLNNVFVNYASQNIGNGVRKDAFSRIMEFSYPQVESFGTGSLITRLTNDITQIQNLVSQFIRGGVRTVLMLIGSLWFLFRLNAEFGWIVLAVTPFMLICVYLALKTVGPLFPVLQSQLDKVNEVLQEDISGIRIIKASVREAYERIRFGKANDALIGTQLRILFIYVLMNPAMNLLMSLAIVGILYEGSILSAEGAATPGAVMAGITYTGRLLISILMLVMIFQTITRGLASWRRVKEVTDAVPEMPGGTKTEGPGPRGSIEFRDVSFAYPDMALPVLEHVSFSVKPGESVAVMGATGCGKTALVSLIPRFYDAGAGEVLVDGLNVREFTREALLSRVSIALQKSELFAVSVADNIRWGKPGASGDEVGEAARIAQADGFVRELPEGYETQVAEGGSGFSGGQRQRLSLARAVAKPAPILILDDATSALDLKTEAAFYEALGQARRGQTRVIVAQRAATARRADRILVLDLGGIAGFGTHEELLKGCAAYREIWLSQMGGRDE